MSSQISFSKEDKYFDVLSACISFHEYFHLYIMILLVFYFILGFTISPVDAVLIPTWLELPSVVSFMPYRPISVMAIGIFCFSTWAFSALPDECNFIYNTFHSLPSHDAHYIDDSFSAFHSRHFCFDTKFRQASRDTWPLPCTSMCAQNSILMLYIFWGCCLYSFHFLQRLLHIYAAPVKNIAYNTTPLRPFLSKYWLSLYDYVKPLHYYHDAFPFTFQGS